MMETCTRLTPLIATPVPFPTESLWGYALRVAELNGYESVGTILYYAQFSLDELKSVGFSAQKFAAILGKDAASLDAISYKCLNAKGEREFKILDHALGKTLVNQPLRLRSPAICLQCVQEKGYIDAFWDLSLAVACPTHGCYLTSRCSRCHHEMGWFRKGMLVCRCGAQYDENFKPVPGKALLRLMEVVRARLHRQCIPGHGSIPGEYLESLPMKALHEVLFALGAFNMKSYGLPKVKAPTLLATGAAKAIDHWPYGFHDMLDRLSQLADAPHGMKTDLRLRYGSFYDALFKHRKVAEHTEFLRREFIRYCQDKLGIDDVEDRIRYGSSAGKQAQRKSLLSGDSSSDGKDAGQRKFHLRQITCALGCHEAAAAWLIDRGYFSVQEGERWLDQSAGIGKFRNAYFLAERLADAISVPVEDILDQARRLAMPLTAIPAKGKRLGTLVKVDDLHALAKAML